jgi:antitoxin component YwqK of YwqJK toxin-antitoxin module
MKKYILIFLIMCNYIPSFNQSLRLNPLKPAVKDSENKDTILHRDPLYTGINTVFYNIAISVKSKDSILIKGVIYYQNGIKNKVEEFYPTGEKYSLNEFNKKGKNGVSINYYQNGQLKCFIYFKDDSILIPKLTWHSNGQIESLIDFHSNNVIKWYDNSLIEFIGNNLPNSENGYNEKYFYENGQLEAERIEHMGKQVYKEYFENGVVKIIGKYDNYFYNKVGKWQQFYNTGKPESESNYSEIKPNVEDGIWKWWDENGNLILTKEYLNGKLVKTHVTSISKGL